MRPLTLTVPPVEVAIVYGEPAVDGLLPATLRKPERVALPLTVMRLTVVAFEKFTVSVEPDARLKLDAERVAAPEKARVPPPLTVTFPITVPD
ncbi:MAG TPA: hypothetical protein VMH40_18490 [Myxococcaceae bacterium]|nr:hypothetical protein [Myxococcaceae bacterium]